MNKIMRLQCNKCFEEVKRVYVQDTDEPLTDVFYCDSHGILTMKGMELWEDESK